MLQNVIGRLRLSRLLTYGLAGLLLSSATALHAADWFALGPYGGNVRSLAADPLNPKHVYLGTETGWIYDSGDGGSSWNRLAELTRSEDLVISRILVDPGNPKRLIVSAFRFDRPDGGVFVSEDHGKTWYAQAEMRGQSVRSLARSASDPRVLAAGTLQGVFLSKDNGVHWSQISPAASSELHEVESIAIDPTDPSVIYAGTWHLPWKTSDGGATWTNIKQGIIDDSDVFSIIIDPSHPRTIYASACSGIYKSLDGGGQFRKIQGIPSTARRTRRLMQDPTAPDTVFAGTTEGLYRTRNAGESFARTTGSDIIINDVYVDPSRPDHVLLATDRGGVLSSDDGGDTFQPSNRGFSARQVLAYAADPQNPGTLYVGVVNDKETGGVFQSRDGGVQWTQQSDGLGGRDVFSLIATPTGTLLAGTSHGVFRLASGMWNDSNAMSGSRAVDAVAQTPANSRPPDHAVDVISTGQSSPALAGHGGSSVSAPKSQSVANGRTKLASKTASKAAGTHTRKSSAVRGRATARDSKPSLRRVSAKSTSGRTFASPQHARPKMPQATPPRSEAPPLTTPRRLDATVYGIAPLADSIFAATSSGLIRSSDDGQSWASVESLTMPETRFVSAQKTIVLVGGLRRLSLSMDSGMTWDTLALPADLTQLSAMAVDELGNLWVGGAEGVYYSTDYGLNWKTLRNLFVTEVGSIYFDALNHRVLVTTLNATMVFAAHLPDYKVSFWDSGWRLRFVRPVGDHLIGATLFDGMVLQPRLVPAVEKASVSGSGGSVKTADQR